MQKEVIGDATLYLGDCLEVLREIPVSNTQAFRSAETAD